MLKTCTIKIFILHLYHKTIKLWKKYLKMKQCNHKFQSVYYGSEWEVECEKCDRNIYDLYSKEDANEIINEKVLKCKTII